MADARGVTNSVGPEFVGARRLTADVLVVGGASLDQLHFRGRTERSAGGAGMYTAAAAHRVGAQVAMFAPLPHPMPEALQAAAKRITWFGPKVSPLRLPHFEITHHGAGVATLDSAEWGSESQLRPVDLPADLSGCELVHIAALSSAWRQLEFLDSCRQRGARLISVGTYGRVVQHETVAVHRLIQKADIFFMNEHEALGMFGSLDAVKAESGKLLFVTFGHRGVRVWQGQHETLIPVEPASELDPTGAGDAFCGATLARLANGDHPLRAASAAQFVAAQVVTAVGPRVLWNSGILPGPQMDRRVSLCQERISAVAELLAGMENVHPFAFVGPGFPKVGASGALEFFFAATLQQFGFWQARSGRYWRPLLAPIDGAHRKGSDYLWHAMLRAYTDTPELFSSTGQYSMTSRRLRIILRADDGTDPMPARRMRLQQARAYGYDMLSIGLSPSDIVARANCSHKPLLSFLTGLDHIGGYKEDVLRKKSVLLALILSERPEKFLRIGADESLPPIIDYHLMRSCLRVGLVDVLDTSLRRSLVERRLIPAADEWAIRSASHDALMQLVELSGKSMAAVDWFFFNARRRCPEMHVPDCSSCSLDLVCAHKKELFQPVLRTAFY